MYAHSTSRKDKADWEGLLEHLEAVAARAGGFAEAFGGEEAARLAGYLHDLGKAKPAFQRRLEGGPKVAHAGEGATLAVERFDRTLGVMLAFCIAGHHAGLPDRGGTGAGRSTLEDWLAGPKSTPWPFDEALIAPPAQAPAPIRGGGGFAQAFFIRMVFSCLVDADFLETEVFYNRIEGKPPRETYDGTLDALRRQLNAQLADKSAKAKADEVNRVRAEVLQACREAAERETGLFTLTVPTGGGKTLSSLAFALDHAAKHGLERVIYVAPFTSIIEQTAKVFRDALKDDAAILEHHSAFDWEERKQRTETKEKKTGPEDESFDKLRQASENWDRPIVVTTAVQFFESLFANKTSRCRKLHNLAKAVIVLDEAQTLPLKVLRPCLAALKELARGYGSSVVLCTATQPAVRRMDGFTSPEALEIGPAREIAPDPEALFQRLARVRFERAAGTMDDDALVTALAEVDQGLAIVNNRRHALDLFEAMAARGVAGARHLTTAMTVRHRQAVLAEIRADLEAGRPVRLVATSLIEAGVDISFKRVWRALAGLDSIAQAAGRCNREGELGAERGLVTIFEPEEIEGRAMPPELTQFAEAARLTLDRYDDPLHPDTISAYFEELYWRRGAENLDATRIEGEKKSGVLQHLSEPKLRFRFAKVGRHFRLIEDTMVPVIVPWKASPEFGAPEALISGIEDAFVVGPLARKVQPYTVQISRADRGRLLQARAARILNARQFGTQFVLLTNDDLYTAGRGLDWREPTERSVAGGIIGTD